MRRFLLHNSIRVLVLTGILLLLGALATRTYEPDSYSTFRNLPQKDEERYIRTLTGIEGPEAAWIFLKTAYSGADGILSGGGDPHTLAHLVGFGFYQARGLDGISGCDHTFNDACYHGVLAATVQSEGASSMSKIKEACNHSPNVSGCIHGVGHGIDEWENYDLAKALYDCDTYFSEHFTSCGSGVLMDNNNSWKKEVIADDPWYYCRSVPSKYRTTCAESEAEYLGRNSKDVRSIAAICTRAPTTDMTQTCLRSLGHTVVRAAYGNTETILKECNLLHEDEINQCLFGASTLIMQRGYSESSDIIATLCSRITSVLRKECLWLIH